jgi:hypothetical protein
MSWKLIGRMGMVGGAILLLVSLAANPIGIGSNPQEFGWLQTLGSVLGCLAIAGGMWLSMRDD